jgi:hypothetical protein
MSRGHAVTMICQSQFRSAKQSLHNICCRQNMLDFCQAIIIRLHQAGLLSSVLIQQHPRTVPWFAFMRLLLHHLLSLFRTDYLATFLWHCNFTSTLQFHNSSRHWKTTSPFGFTRCSLKKILLPSSSVKWSLMMQFIVMLLVFVEIIFFV